MGGGYKDYFTSEAKNYWLSTQHISRGDQTTYVNTLQRFYSGATMGNEYNYSNVGIGYLLSKSMIVGQIGNNIYVVTANSSSHSPIYKYLNGYDDYTDYIEVEDKDAILDYLPESWLLYAKNIDGYDITSRMCCYNHDTLVADGIEQS